MSWVIDANRIRVQRRFRSRDGFDCVRRDIGSARLRQPAQRFPIYTSVALRGSNWDERTKQKGGDARRLIGLPP